MQEHRILLMNKKGETLDLNKVSSYKQAYYSNIIKYEEDPYSADDLEINFIDLNMSIGSMKEEMISFTESGLNNAQIFAKKYDPGTKMINWVKIDEVNLDGYSMYSIFNTVMGRRSDFWVIFRKKHSIVTE